jgi:hypothetical protein
MPKPTANTDYELLANFEAVRKTLLEKRYRDCLDKPLAFWALSTDRRLPLAFMARPLRELLATPFDQLYATPGVGQKKIHSLVKLLLRASQNPPQEFVPPTDNSSSPVTIVDASDWSRLHDAAGVSEAAWAQWREAISRHGLNQEPLGRFAASLQKLPRVIWTTPLAAYVELSLAEMRALKTYGEKRVNAVLEVFGSLQSVLAAIDAEPHLAVHISCRTVYEIERWSEQTLAAEGSPSYRELRGGLVEPMVRQLQIDAGDAVARLAESRLELFDSSNSVRNVARRMELTRARIYQLLDGVNSIMQIRWPGGPNQLARLASKLASSPTEASAQRLFRAAADLFFPGSFAPPEVAVEADGNGSSRGAARRARS